MTSVMEGTSKTKTKKFRVKHPKRKLFRLDQKQFFVCLFFKITFVSEVLLSVKEVVET
jgi:hypothetical protein